MHHIEEARKRAGITGAELSYAVGRPGSWLVAIESGKYTLTPEIEKILLTAISRLERFKKTVEEAKEKLTLDLRLPAPTNVSKRRPGGYEPRLPGTHAA
jgi:hypothetical protein